MIEQDRHHQLFSILDLVAIAEQFYRVGQGLRQLERNELDPFMEMLFCRSIFFIDNTLRGYGETAQYAERPLMQYFKEAHCVFLELMKGHGWTIGPENFLAKTHPNLIPWTKLPKPKREKYLLTCRLVEICYNYYNSLKQYFEWSGSRETLNNFRLDPINPTDH